MNKTALVSTANLMFSSKLSLMLQELGLGLVKLRADDDLLEVIQERQPVIVIIDLGKEPLVSITRIKELRDSQTESRVPILCFGPHVATEVMAAAEQAGADLVVPNSVISVRGTKLIAKLLQTTSEG